MEWPEGALNQVVRIIAGCARGLRLHSLPGDATRPSSDRLKESLFSMLLSRTSLVGAQVLDLYAGSGALGLEALSRGAGRAILVERSAAAASVCRTNAVRVAAAGGALAEVLVAGVEHSWSRLAAAGPFDLVLADPPYLSDDGQRLLNEAPWPTILDQKGWLVIEHRSPLRPGTFLDQVEQRRYGTHLLSFFQRRRTS